MRLACARLQPWELGQWCGICYDGCAVRVARLTTKLFMSHILILDLPYCDLLYEKLYLNFITSSITEKELRISTLDPVLNAP